MHCLTTTGSFTPSWHLFLSTARSSGTPKMGGHFVSSDFPLLSLSLSVCLDFFNLSFGFSFFSFFFASFNSFCSLLSFSFSFASFSFFSFFSFLARPILNAFFFFFPLSSSSLELSSPRCAYLVSFSFSFFFSLSFFLADPSMFFSFLELLPPASLPLKAITNDQHISSTRSFVLLHVTCDRYLILKQT